MTTGVPRITQVVGFRAGHSELDRVVSGRRTLVEAELALFVTGDLVIATAAAKSKWTDWRTIHVEKGSFLNEMLGDRYVEQPR